ncbi:hypothetical protein PVAND_013278 [Polypedilum vanderplanki]|uniref:Deoxynucleoside kinase domain-containing protein n=1 Tax=Polypedilum vanderplanki TaxID=319348 RepID=A0A9J6CP71_POLVA|nr:hypothetical protein PVAND_013278 [Polypedilum vanderplanki]
MSKETPFTVFIEGNIGSGKTTFLKHFSKFENVSLVFEPVGLWQNLNGYNLLELQYEDPEKWHMSLQSYVMLTVLRNHLENKTDKPIKIMERSLYCGQFCYVEQMFANKTLEPAKYYVLQEWYNFIHERHKSQCDLIIYLRTNPENALKRIRKRGRTEESGITIEYLRELHNHHENRLIHGKFYRPAPVLVIDADSDKENILKEYEKAEKIILRDKN